MHPTIAEFCNHFFYIVGNESVLRGLRAYGDLLEWISRRAGFYDPDVVF